MEYQQAVSYIHSLLKFGIKPGLERMNALLDEIGHPEQKLRFIHVAGTNGKGSTCSMLSNILKDAGYKTGLFTSPYVVDFCERMQINGQMISHEALAREVEIIIPVLEKLKYFGIQPTEFEVITALAFHYFAEERCDIVVLEVGLGGRLDSTNVIPCPLASIITSVSYDHMAVLGNTLTEIASEKCGIIKENGRTISYPCQKTEVFHVLEAACSERCNPFIVPDLNSVQIKEQKLGESTFIYEDVEYKMYLTGEHQVYNALTVIAAAQTLQKNGIDITSHNIVNGISKTVIPARMELMQRQPPVVLDGGHNEDCAVALQSVLKTYFENKRVVGLIGMMADKEYEKYLSSVAPYFDEIICTVPHNPRALPAKILAQAASQYCKKVSSNDIIPFAVTDALTKLREADALVVCGSFYLASEVRPFLQHLKDSKKYK